MTERLRHRVHAILEGDGRVGRAVAILLTALILASVLATVLESTVHDPARMPWIYPVVEWVSALAFSVEYVLRLWAAGAHAGYRGIRGRLRYAATPLALIDLIAVAPFWWNVLLGGAADLRVMRLLRVLRLLRIAKLGRHSRALHALGRAFWARRAELTTSLVILAVLLLIASTLMYHVEHENHPAFDSIPEAMWWGIATLTTVGYGDVVPQTALGKVLGAVIAVLGIGIFALPAGILTAALQDALRPNAADPDQPAPTATTHPPAHCPHCGGALTGAAAEHHGSGAVSPPPSPSDSTS